MTALEIFMAGGGTALFCWAVNIIYQMAKASSNETNDF